MLSILDFDVPSVKAWANSRVLLNFGDRPVDLPTGAKLLLLGSANRDEAAFAGGEHLDSGRSPYGLAGYVFSRATGRALRAAEALEAGSVWVNNIHRSTTWRPSAG